MAHHDPQPKPLRLRTLAVLALAGAAMMPLIGCSTTHRPDGPPKAGAYSTSKVQAELLGTGNQWASIRDR